MKTLKNSIIAVLAIFAASCNPDDVENRPVVVGIDAPVLSGPEEGNNYILIEDNADVIADRFVWSAANFGEGVIPAYDVEIDFAGQSFDTPVIVASTNGATQVAVSQNALNTAVTALEAVPEEPSTFEVRIKAYVGTNVLYSNAVEITVTPYVGVVPLPNLFILGTATEFGFENNVKNTPLFRDNADQNLYHFTGYFNAGDLKFISFLGQWQPQYGIGAAAGTLAVNDGTGTDPEPIVIAEAGYYSLTVNLTDMTYEIAKFDASAAPTYKIGIIGDATPTAWDSDTDLVNTDGNKHIWHLESINLAAGGAKFRSDDTWDNSWGAATFPAGKGANSNDPNIAVTAETAGEYEVWFNDLDGRYLFILKN